MPGRGRGGPLPRPVQVSKKIAWLLRHGAAEEGLQLDAGGYLNVQEVLSNRKIRSLKVTFAELRELVQDNDKQRFTLAPAASDTTETSTAQTTSEQEVQQPTDADAILLSDKPSDWRIRANQGHSLKVEDEGLLTAITAENLPEAAVHGTTHAAWPLILASGGLKRMTRNHVHFAAGLPAGFTSLTEDRGDDGSGGEAAAAAPVISGMRKSSTVLMYLDLRKAMDAGLKFWLSDNGVILSEGNADGLVPLEVFKRVEDRTGEGVLVEDGKVVKEAPAGWANKKGGKGQG
ncbi:hypothetical protein LTR36_008005 [Oleoguttula mirabilis]|uniref:2'-phosphotransferase n=1 Tax=Oleoguttula mirabilis TaxID=1507867 RepID=A0AAV9J8I4_9PEZI|nr:hypothetical protein LTR36_008005 [Oleoguttula mirabilis]